MLLRSADCPVAHCALFCVYLRSVLCSLPKCDVFNCALFVGILLLPACILLSVELRTVTLGGCSSAKRDLIKCNLRSVLGILLPGSLPLRGLRSVSLRSVRLQSALCLFALCCLFVCVLLSIRLRSVVYSFAVCALLDCALHSEFYFFPEENLTSQSRPETGPEMGCYF